MTPSKPKRIDQMLPSYVKRDAIGNHVRHIQSLLVERGFESSIYAEQWSKQTKDDCRDYLKYATNPSERSMVIYHFSVGSPVMNYLTSVESFIAINYHNITPPEYFDKEEQFESFKACRQGLRQLPLARSIAEECWTVSQYNAKELVEQGFEKPQIFPVLRDYAYISKLEDSSGIGQFFSKKVKTILFVGRVEPHKGHSDLFFLVKAYKEVFKERLRLVVVGNASPRQMQKLEILAAQLNLTIARGHASSGAAGADILFPGEISDQEMAAFYRHADAFVCLSEHEGFCVPLVEAMFFGLPILAHGAAAVPETCGEAGLIVDKSNFLTLTSSLYHLLNDAETKRIQEARSLKRAEDFSWPNLEKQFDRALSHALAMFSDSSKRPPT